MIVLKYRKSGSARFISHIDLLRHTSRILRRADIPVNYSQGFNPHALVYFSPPLAVGVTSDAEYLAIDTPLSAGETLARYNSAVFDTLSATEVFECAKNPNLQGKIAAADYVFDTPFKEIDLIVGFIVEYQKKGQTVSENVADKIFAVFEKDGKLALRLATGNTNLRPDRLLPELNKRLGSELCVTDIVKIAQYVEIDGKYVDVDGYLKSDTVR